ncbi:hypothetical protein DFJ74DRAFT_529386 [Hyaloraphidium curvatum]|nr:hypothetical protein DFJ74DRAFT_529386 [Hyaloraphidium curvatum]
MMDTSHSTKPVVPPNKTSSAPASSALERLMQKARAESEADLANRRAKRLKSSESSSSGASPGPEPKQNPTQGLNFFQSKNQETHGDGLPSDAAFATFKLLGGNKIKVLTIVDGEEEAQLRQAFDRARLRCKQRLDPESAEGRSRKDLVAAYELEVDNKMNLPETANIRRGKVVRAAPTGGDIFSNTTIVGVYPRTGHLDDIEKLNLERGCLQTPCTTKGFMEAALASMGLGSAKDVLCADKVPTCPEPNKLLDGVARTAFKGREHLFDLFSPGTHDFVAKTSSSLKVMFQPEIVAEHITRFSPYKDYFVVFDKSRPLTGAVHLGDATVLEVLRGTGAGANKFGTEPSLMLPFKEHPSSAGARNVPIEYRIQMLNRNDRVFTQIGDVLQTGTFRTVQPGSFFQLAFRTDGWENMAKIGELSAKTGGLERLMSLLDRTYLFPSKEQLPDMLVALQELGFEDSARIVEKSWDLHYVGKPTFQILAMLRVLQFNKETNQAGPSAGGKKSGPKLFAEKEGIYNPKFLGKKIEWVTAGAENQGMR